MHRCLILTRRFNRCYWVFLIWFSKHVQLHRCLGRRFFRQPSYAPMVHRRFNRCCCFCSFSSNSSRQSFGFLKYILSLDFHYTLAPLRLIGLVILMLDWTWRLDDRLDIASRRWIRRVNSYPWDLIAPTSVVSQTHYSHWLCCHSITKITNNGLNGAMFLINLYIYNIIFTTQMQLDGYCPH